MKRITAFLLSVIIMVGLFTGCKKNEETEKTDNRLKIVTTLFPAYDWVREIAGDAIDGISLEMLTDGGIDFHSYQPTVNDIVRISECDVFIYAGTSADNWVDDVINDVIDSRVLVINLSEIPDITKYEEEIAEGMQKHGHEHGENGETEFDEHTWLSVKNAAVFSSKIADVLSVKNPENEAVYRKNAEAYKERLKKLDEEYRKEISSAENKVVVFADRFPFRYLAEDYGLKYYAAFPGCSAESEASFETISFLAKKVEELSLPAVLVIEDSNVKIANAVVSAVNGRTPKIITVDSMQSVSKKDIETGITYISVMEENLKQIKIGRAHV